MSDLPSVMKALLLNFGPEEVKLEFENQTYTHGTEAAYTWHVRRKVPTCAPCRAWNAQKTRDLKARRRKENS